jgi:enamine deaminase RidA (YjgF/YER057c/UK114 family)
VTRPDPHARLAELGLRLPAPTTPVAAYLPAVLTGRTLYVSGQLPFADGELLSVGAVGEAVTVEQAAAAARQCAVNVLAVADGEVGLGALTRVVKLVGFVASAPGFTAQPAVVNGASDLMSQVFGDAGRHARSAVGVGALPLGASVEVEAILEVGAEAADG